ncbi:MAG: beta-ketoacyl-[acyl-carrier-protein] synthase family protein [Pirellulales bacterium]
MASGQDVVITGLGIVSPIGIGPEAFWASLREGRSGVGPLRALGAGGLRVRFGAEVADFDPKEYVKPRKSLKVMSRDIQLGYAAADMAARHAGLDAGAVAPERYGVSFGADLMPCDPEEIAGAYRRCIVDGEFEFSRWGEQALAEIYPLWMLKYLPNMPACHIAIAQDARGPNNSITLGEVSSLLAVAEAYRVIERQDADVIIAGGTSSRVTPTALVRNSGAELSAREDDPARASRPFDAQRDGMVNGEGAAAFILESRRHAEARGAKILARILGFANAFEPRGEGRTAQGAAIRRAVTGALRDAGLTAADIGHVNAHGISTIEEDRLEARAIRETLGDVPVTAPKSFFGNLGAGSGVVEMAASVLGLVAGEIPVTLNYEYPDPTCPVNVVHGEPGRSTSPTALVLNHALMGQAVAVVLARE